MKTKLRINSTNESSIWDQTVRFAHVTSLRVEGKQTHILCNPKTLLTHELRQRSTKYCRWEIMFIYGQRMLPYLIPFPTPLIPLRFTSNGRRTHRFASITVNCWNMLKECQQIIFSNTRSFEVWCWKKRVFQDPWNDWITKAELNEVGMINWLSSFKFMANIRMNMCVYMCVSVCVRVRAYVWLCVCVCVRAETYNNENAVHYQELMNEGS
jgi:hypothetical protein